MHISLSTPSCTTNSFCKWPYQAHLGFVTYYRDAGWLKRESAQAPAAPHETHSFRIAPSRRHGERQDGLRSAGCSGGLHGPPGLQLCACACSPCSSRGRSGRAGHAGPAPAAHADKFDDAAKKLSAASYPLLKEIDWSSDIYGKLPTASPLDVLKAVDKMIVMGAAMDSSALKAGALAHSNAISCIDANGVTTLADYEAINAAIGHMVASATQSKSMDVYNAIAKFNLGKDVGPYMMSKVNAADASTAYKAFLEFKESGRRWAGTIRPATS